MAALAGCGGAAGVAGAKRTECRGTRYAVTGVHVSLSRAYAVYPDARHVPESTAF